MALRINKLVGPADDLKMVVQEDYEEEYEPEEELSKPSGPILTLDHGMVQFADIIFCCPGHPVSKEWQMRLDRIKLCLNRARVSYAEATAIGPDVMAVRNYLLGPHGHRIDQKPFAGKLDYKWLCWIDSDNYVDPEQIIKLRDWDVDIAAGWCKVHPPGNVNDENKINVGQYGEKNNALQYTMKSLLETSEAKAGTLLEVGYVGFGLMLVKKKVMDALDYPWFQGWVWHYKDEDGHDCGECIGDDIGFCKRVKERGFKIYVDPAVQVGHYKGIVI